MLSESLFERASLCVVGNINRDIKTLPFPAGGRLLEDGETPVGGIFETIGGGGANSAFTARALGARVTFLGKTGADGLGSRLERTLAQAGIAAFLCKDPEHPSGTSLALTYSTGSRHFISCLPASRALRFEDLDAKQLNGHGHLLRADIWFSESMLFEGNLALLQTARKLGLRTSIDLNWDPAWGVEPSAVIRDRKKAVREILPLVDLAHGNTRELCEFSDAADLDLALKRIAGWGAGGVVVHLGAQGAGYYCGSHLEIQPPVAAKTQVNAAGTGDVLSVCMMLLDGAAAPVTARLQLANHVVTEFIEGRRHFIPVLCG